MYLKQVQIVNYKNLMSSTFTFNKGTNTVIGENDSGKSNAMTAIRILLDSSYFYSEKTLKEIDFSESLGDWKGHWIVISALFDEISNEDKYNEFCAELIPSQEDEVFLRSFIRCEGYEYGTVTLFIRPNKTVRQELAKAKNKESFEEIREKITLADYEFYYTSRSQADYTDPDIYQQIVGNFETGSYINPDNEDLSLLGTKIDIMNVWKHISVVFVDALRDVESELKKSKNPIKRVFNIIQNEISDDEKKEIEDKIEGLNKKISSIPKIIDIGKSVNEKLNEIVGLVYSPEIAIESRIREDISSLSKHLAVVPNGEDDIDLLGLGHLNILYIALKLVEFEYNRNHEILNIMIIEEPEAHIHTHIQKTLFDNLKLIKDYTQVIMTTHSTQLSEVSDVKKMNVLKMKNKITEVMIPTKNLDVFGKEHLQLRDLSLSDCLERYLDAKRSVLLFSKGVILVEGDGEEILIPSLIRKVLGVSLDELGVGLINVGNVAFEYIASIFSSERLKRHCAIITDFDKEMVGATKSNSEAAKRGVSRKEKLEMLFSENPWVESFYAEYTFEVDFANLKQNREYISKAIDKHYIQKAAKNKHMSALDNSDAKRYDSVLTVANEIGKGWLATLLAFEVDVRAEIPEYILRAIVFASQDIINFDIIWKMLNYSLGEYEETDEIIKLKERVSTAFSKSQKEQLILEFCEICSDDMFTKFLEYRKELNYEI